MSTQVVLPKFEVPPVPDSTQTDKLTKPLIAQSIELRITDDDTFIAAWALVERHDEAIKKVGEWFDPFVDGLHKMHKAAVALRNQFLTPLEESKKRLLAARVSYRAEQDRLARERAEFQAEILRKQQAAELLKEAKKLEKSGDIESAAVVREQAKTMPAPVVAVESIVPKQAGSVEKTRWIATVTSYELVPIEYRTLDPTKKTERELIDSKIQGVVANLGNTIKIPGVDIRKDTTEHSRAVR